MAYFSSVLTPVSTYGACSVGGDFLLMVGLCVMLPTTIAGAENKNLSSSAEQPDGTKVDLRVGIITSVRTHESADK